MNWSFDIGRIFGIRIRVHYAFLFLLLLIGWSASRTGGLAAALMSMVAICLVFVFVVLHELGHSLVAMRFGVRVWDITLLPIGGMARMESIPESPFQEICIALAGPAVNFICVLLLLPFLVGISLSKTLLFPGAVVTGQILHMLVQINLMLGIFNLLPAFPLDGGRVARAFMAMRMPYLAATSRAVRLGRYVALGLCVVSLWQGSLWLILIALFIFMAGKQEELAVRAREFQRRVVDFPGAPARGVYFDPYALEETARRIDEIMRQMNAPPHHPRHFD